ncbi:MAG: lysophospholipid acyltransferase family protein [Acetobacteraceae bacterium]|nr:lysophospholipid acyltransferase family protein [Acetobacteraceae bacterium]
MLKSLLRRPGAQATLAWLSGLYLDFALRTTRWRIVGFEHLAPHVAGRPVIVAFWHERLPLMPMLWRTAQQVPGARLAGTRVYVLVSSHRDGRFIGAVMRRFRMETVFGSSSRGGARGLRNMLGLLARGDFVAITPDGPRGPRRRAAPGVAQLAALSGVPVLPCAGQTTRRRVLSSWDRMVAPVPFGRAVVVCRPTISVARDGWEPALPAIVAALDEAAATADRLCAE